MALKVRSIQGTMDIVPEQSHKWQYIERVTREIAESYGVREIRVPTIEKTELFLRSVGETTDVVQKEMYTFEKGKNSITLRPEGTAGTVRAVLQNSLLNSALPVKVCYNISCFRHERPQSGRYREFHQFGVEYFGTSSPTADAEIMALVKDIFDKIGITQIDLQINSIGCPKCRPQYNAKLVEYYSENKEKLCHTCLERLEKNPLRLLDCKEEGCKKLAEKAPTIIENLCDECEEHFSGVKARLSAMGIDYTVNPFIVRGLDYYTKTVFEFTTSTIGAQGTVCGGGRYDLLVEQMGGAPTPALGFGMGLERLIMVAQAAGCAFPEPQKCKIYIGSMGEAESLEALKLASAVRKEGFMAICDTMNRSVKAQMKYADKIGAEYSCIIGESELSEKKLTVKHMESGQTKEIILSEKSVIDFLYENGLESALEGAEKSILNFLSDNNA